ncbi:hypothetical protein BG011_005337 [Mortierella polycephala]|uniref:Transcription initiation factor TFIID subunit 4 n=1 Tax=Mortierella polycephala TaxID=41804 RepID=A0A9P6PYX7_9FUNG|nr:hypothetical protein BG011_005337 [Mortierella polycephala]
MFNPTGNHPNEIVNDNSGNNNNAGADSNGQHHQKNGQGSALPLMHGTMDELLSADFPLGMGNVRHTDGALNNGVHGNIMEGLDDLFNDDFPSVGNQQHLMHMPGHPQQNTVQHPQSLPASMQFPPTQSPQQQVSPLLQHQTHQITGPLEPTSVPLPGHTGPTSLQGQQPSHQLPTTPSHLSQSPQVSPAMPLINSPVHQVQPNRPQQTPPALPQSYPPSMPQQQPQQQSQSMNQSTAPRSVQTSIVQTPPPSHAQVQSRPAPNGQLATSAVARPTAVPNTLTPAAAAAPIPIAQAGSPLHHILTNVSPATGQQLKSLFALLQTNAVTPNEFLAHAEKLLDPAQFEILDGIRRRHAARPTPEGTASQQQSPNVSAANIPSLTTLPKQSMALGTATGQIRSTQGMSLQAPDSGVGVPSTAAGVSSMQPVSIASATTSMLQSAPVRKRTTDNITVATPSIESKLPPKRVKTEHQTIVPGAMGTGINSGAVAQSFTSAMPHSFPSTPGPATPGGVSSPATFNRVSLPGQQRASPMATATGAGAIGGGGVSSAVAGGSGAALRAGATGSERVDYDNITDVISYVGVDLNAESDNIMRDSDGYSRLGGAGDGQDRTRVQNFVNTTLLKTIVERIAATHKLQTVEPDVIAYLALATQERLRGLTEKMIHASKHRGRSLATAPPPMYDEGHAMYKVGIHQDVKRQLLAIERVEREEETKRKEQIAERERRLTAGDDLDENGEPRGGGSGGGGGGGGGPKKGKKGKEGGPAVSARNMSEETRKKFANQTALGFAGGGRTYSWMMGGGGAGAASGGTSSPLPSGPAVSSSSSSPAPGATTAASPTASGGVSAGSGSVRPSLGRMPTSTSISNSSTLGGGTSGLGASGSAGLATPSLSRGASAGGGSMILPPSTLGRPTSLRDSTRKVNIRDALFCLERDRGGGGGEGSGQRVLIKSYVKWLK